uniref:Fibrocystin-L n=1 Tax=Sarcophilus harrisii TaxID=9305 RepID=A0A7N4NVE6_SARHA
MKHQSVFATLYLLALLLSSSEHGTDGHKTISKVTEILPKYGSINGATRLTIKGEGFAQANQFNYGVDNELLGNSVHFVSASRSIPCDVEKDASHSTHITCYTRAMPEDTYSVQVSVDGVSITNDNICRGHINSWACSFQTKNFRTPTIRSITPLTGLPGSIITIQGRIFTDVYGNNIALSSNGKNVRILRVYVGGMPCELLIPQSDNLYGLKLDHENSDMGTMICKITGTYIGHHNVSFILDSDYGRSFPQLSAYFVSSLNKIAMFQTYAEVTKISPSKGSIQGGTLLTITGNFFDQTDFPVRVIIGGQSCKVLRVTENNIYCRTPPKPSGLKTMYPGGRGLKLEVWNNSRPTHLEEILEYNESTQGYMGDTWVDTASYVWPMEQDMFVARFSGFLVAPNSDSYRFYIKGDDRYAVYFSPTGNPEEKVKIAYHSSYANSYFSSPTQRSDVFQLQKGKEYYIEILLQEYRQSAFVDVGLYQHRNFYTEQQTSDSVNEEQVIQAQSVIVPEVQVITLENWKTTNPKNEIQKITVSSPCMKYNACSFYQYSLIYNKEKTGLLPADASDTAMELALNDLLSIQPDVVHVVRTEGNQSYVYTVTFKSARGDFDLITYEVLEGSNITVEIAEQTKGIPSLDTFTLTWDGISSKPLTPWSSENEVQAAIEEMVSAKCPKEISHLKEGFAVKYFKDYETDFSMKHINRGQMTSETEAYCGRYSLKNPAILFDSTDVKPNGMLYGNISLFPYNQFCLAYKGFLMNNIGLKFQYQDSKSKAIKNTFMQFSFPFIQGSSWTYTCIDLLYLIQEKYSGKNFFLQRISLQKASEVQSFYVDVVYLGQTATISNIDEVPKRRLPALANRGIFLKHFEVKQTKIIGSSATSQYTVTMTSCNCSYRIPLLAVGFAQVITNITENESVYRGMSWPGESQIRIQRIQAASPPIHGSFDIQAYGHVLKGLSADISAVDLQYALQSIPEMGQISVIREGNCAGYSWKIKWRSTCGKQNLLQIKDVNITGEEANVTVTKITEGGLFRQHILGDLLRTTHEQPQVQVYINELPAKCSGNCGYKWDPLSTPTILATSPTQGSYDEKTILTISGSGFSSNPATSVTIGSVDCPILSVYENEIKCQILTGKAGNFPIAVFVAEMGFADHSGGEMFNFTYNIQILHIWPASGSLEGGTLLTLSGFGFAEDSKILVGNKSCNVIKGNLNEIKCRTPKGAEGTFDVTVMTNGLYASANSAFSYNISQTPTIMNFSPKTRVLQGKVNLTIKGYNFGNEHSQNMVYVGRTNCTILHWNFTDITCLLPKLSPGNYDICVEVGNWGFASPSEELNVSIQYILQVTNVFPQKGSLYGGTEITLMGFGFSTTPEENSVFFGSFPCNVTSSSENNITCILHSTKNVFRVTNQGEDSVYGKGYAWSPSVLNISVGDMVIWQWQAQPFIRGIGYRVFSVSSPGNVIYDGKGFTSGNQKTTSGSFSYQFTSPGIYYYSSGFINEAQSIFLQGVINVLPAKNKYIPLHLFISGTEATYAQGVSNESSMSISVAECIAEESSYIQNKTVVKNLNGIFFELSSCYSPSISNISPSYGTVNEAITITGHHFNSLGYANKVTIGGYPCVIESSSENVIICYIDPQNSMAIGVGELVTLIVDNLGTAINTLTRELDRRFVLLPHIDTVTPHVGSTRGMTRVIIKGSGFAASSTHIKAAIGGFPCTILSVNYTVIECETSPAPEQRMDIDLRIHDIPAQCQGNCTFSYLDNITPFVTGIFPNTLQNVSTKFLIEGRGFGECLEDVLVYIGDRQFRAVYVNDTNISVVVNAMPAGYYLLRVVVMTKGLAAGNFTVNSPLVASLLPTSGSTQGGTALIITGNGFSPANTTVTIGNQLCKIVSITPSEIHCNTPASSPATVEVRILINSFASPPLSFTYSQDDTPYLKDVLPDRGPPGTEIEIIGSSFGFDVSEVMVTTDDIQCNITMVNDSVLRCRVGNHAGGIFPVMLRHLTRGYAVSRIAFEHSLTIQNLFPRQGSFGGGLTMTVIGSGFNPQNSMVSVCNTECEVNRPQSDYNTLFCKVPFNNGSETQKDCEVRIANGEYSIQSNTTFTYMASLTPVITDVTPKRGGTEGGTRLTIKGSGFSSNMEDIHVTIGQAVCDVKSTNETHIICITNAHSPSQWVKIYVSVGSNGIAKLDNADFLYIDVWSSNFSWGGQSPPEEGSLVVITKGQIILLDQSTPVLKMLLIQGGSLIFDEADIELQAENILITDGGILQIGTEASPFQHKAVITLHGHLRSPELPVYGAKTLAVREGILDLHGLPIPVTWTRLAQTAEAGESTLVLQEAVTWNVGDEIVIATTGHRHSQKENEKKTIASISDDGMSIKLTSSLKYTHLGKTITLPDGTLFEARAEVGVLTRNILVRGSNNIEWNDKIPACPDGFDTEHKGHSVVPHSSLLDLTHCKQETEWSIGFPGSVCDSSVSFHRLAFNKPSPVSLLEKDVILSDSFGTSIIPFQKKRLTHMSGWMALIPNANHINWYFKGVEHITNISYASTFYGFKDEDYVIISHNFTQKADMFNIIDMRNGSSNPLDLNTSRSGDWHLEKNTSTLYYLVSGRNYLSSNQATSRTLDPGVKDVIVNFQAYCCFFQDCIPLDSPIRIPPPRKRPEIYNLWSNDSFWQSSPENNYSIPQEGANVVIPEGTWMVVDIDIPSLERLIILGVLELEDHKNNVSTGKPIYRKVVLNATYISVQGGRLIGGWEGNPFKGELQIILRGSHSTPEWSLPNGPNQGSKVLGIFGELDLHGITRTVYKTKLSETTLAGSRVISLMDAVDWEVGEDIVITTTSYDSRQTETRKIIQILADQRSFILNDSLSYTHIAERYQIQSTGQNYTLAADVGILSRNIKIIGENYPGLFKESFGARVLVSSFTENVVTYKGNARISNVEFYHSGQEGYRDNTDPRYSLAFLNLGQVQENGSSYVRGCSFHNGFAPAIGVFGTSGLDIEDNIIHLTVGEGLKIWGNGNHVRRNLVAFSVWPGTYQNRKELTSTLWHAAIEINMDINTVLQDNVVAGFERIGYHINGESCSDQTNSAEKWHNNEAHGGLYGVYMNQDGFPGCSHIQGFTVWKCWDYGIYFQTTESVQVSNVTLVDNGMGILPIVYLPAATSHKISSKTVLIKNLLIVGSSPQFNCSDVLTNDDPNIELTAAHRSARPPSGGRSGICWPTFASAHNMAPRKPHAGLMSYNAINGLLEVSDSTFVGFKSVCSDETAVMFMTNPLNEDLQHPIHVKNIQTVNTTEQSKIFIHRPDLSKVNPSDCVDMVCDAKKKAFLKDIDGSFLGRPGSVIPHAEYEWNGNNQLGVGDYRIPKVMLTYLNGSKIPISEKAPYKGIVRDSTCKYISEWQSYQCFGMEYAMMVIESLDSDTEIRRLSPVAVFADGYVDLINGPQDHGWCAGYTCQKRLSLFHSIVALNKSYEIYFTGTSPQNLRLMLLNVEQNKAVRVAIFFSTLQRLDVYVNNSLVCPKNTVWNHQQKDCEFNIHLPTRGYLPSPNSAVSGENYFDRTYQMLYLLVKGSTPVEVHTTAVLFISFKLPAMTEDHFYSSRNLVRNLASFLKIPANKIRITKIIRENGRRKKRMAVINIELEIGEPPTQILSNHTTGQMQLSELQEISSCLGQAIILGKINSVLGFNISSMSISNPLPNPNDSGWIHVTAQPVERSAFPINHLALVSSLSVITQPVAGLPGHLFSQQPSIKAIDSDGNCVSVGITSLTLKAILKDASNNQVSGLSGNTTVPFSSCWANYTDLTLIKTGKNYKIEFVLNDVRVESRSFSLPVQSSSSSSDSKSLNMDSTAQKVTIVVGCLLGGRLLLELFMTAILILKGIIDKISEVLQ